MSRPISLKGLDTLGSASIGYMFADLITSIAEQLIPHMFAVEKFASAFYGLTMIASTVGLRILAAKLEENHIISLKDVDGTTTDPKTD